MSRISEFLGAINPFAPPEPRIDLDAIVPGSAAIPVSYGEAMQLMVRPPAAEPYAGGSMQEDPGEALMALFQEPGALHAIEPPLDVKDARPKPAEGEYRQLPYLSMWPTFGDQPTWKPPLARKAINAMDAGDFQMAGLLMEELQKDDANYHGLRTRTINLFTLKQRIIPSKRRGGKRAARIFAQHRNIIFPTGVLREAMKYLYHFRFAILEIVNVKVRNPDGDPPYWDIPQLKAWHPSFIYWRTNFGSELAQYGGDQNGGNYVIITQDGPVDLVGENAPGAGRFVMLNAGGSRPWLDGMIRPLWNPVLRRIYTRVFHARFEERHSLGIIKVRFPTYMGGESADWKHFQESLRTMGSNGVLMCPRDKENPETGIDADFIGPPNAAALQSFDLSKKEQDLDIYTLWLAQSLTTAAGENGGSHAAVIGQGGKEDTLARDDSLTISDAQIEWYPSPEEVDNGAERWHMVPSDGPLRTQVWRYFAYHNFGDPDLAPYFLFDATPDEQRKEAADLKKTAAQTQQSRALAAQQMGNAIADLQKYKTVQYDPAHMFKQIGITLMPEPEDLDPHDDIGVMRAVKALLAKRRQRKTTRAARAAAE